MQIYHQILKLPRYLNVFLSALCFSFCSSNVEDKSYLSKIGITLADKYEIVELNSSSAIGDESIEFKLKVSDKDYQAIINKIKSLEGFQIITDNESPNRNYSGPNRDIEIIGWKKNNSYIYEVSKNSKSGVENYILSLDEKRILHFQYVNE